MRKYIFNGLAALTMGFTMTACTQDFNFEEQEQQASLNNAQQTLGFYIPDNQDWVMSTTATATFNVKGLSDEATVYVFSNNPQVEGTATVLASGPMTGTTTTISDFRLPQHVKSLFVGLKQSNGNINYQYVDVEDGQISASYDFSTTAQARTRSITINNGVYDVFTYPTNDELNSAFPTGVPFGAIEVGSITDAWGTWSNDNNKNFVISSGGNYEIGGSYYNNAREKVKNIYVNTTDDVTITNKGLLYINIFILKGNTSVLSSSEFGGMISVAKDATLTWTQNSVAQNDYIKLFNKGTMNFTNDNIDWGNNCTIYNLATITAKNLSYSPGANNTSYFMNLGENATLTASSMTLNSTCHFLNSGTAIITGNTTVTQAGICWVNNGFYKTGNMIFSANNETFYNYCQLIVEGNLHMYDGAFSLMNDSYTETATADVNNFTVYMGNNAGFNCTGNNTWGDQGGQGDGKYNGFICNGTNSYIRLGGITTVAGHKKALETTGNVTVAINSINDKGAGNSGVQPTVQLNVGKTEVSFDKLYASYNEKDCGATWSENPPVVSPVLENNSWTYAFEDNKTRCDFDLNDVVIQVRESESNPNKLIVKLVAAGCEYDNYVWLGETPIVWEGGAEVHDAFGVTHGVMVNTGNNKGVDKTPVEVAIDMPKNFDFQNADFKIRPFRINSNPNDEANAVDGYISIVKEGVETGLWGPLGLAIPAKWKWPKERYTVNYAYPQFTDWGKEADLTLRADESGWYEYPTSGLVYGE